MKKGDAMKKRTIIGDDFDSVMLPYSNTPVNNCKRKKKTRKSIGDLLRISSSEVNSDSAVEQVIHFEV
jgi:hypothetical protein